MPNCRTRSTSASWASAGRGVYDDTSLVVTMGEDTGDEAKTKEMIAEITRINGLLPIYKKIKRAYLSLDPLPLANGIKVKRQKVKEALERGTGRFEVIDIKSGTNCVTKRPSNRKKRPTAQATTAPSWRRIREQVRGIFADVLGVEPDSISDTAHFVSTTWAATAFRASACFRGPRRVYGVIIPDTEYFSCANVQDLSRLLYRKVHRIEAKVKDEAG